MIFLESNLTLYRIFNSVAGTGNISRSSKELFISQPAVSKAIQTLEENLHMTLFIRSSRGVRLTEEGALLYEYTKSAFDTLKQGELTLFQMQELGIGHLRIGVSTTLCKYILLPYLKDFVKCYPHIKITIECQSTYKTLELLSQNKIDIGLIGKPDNLKGMDFYEVQQIEDIFVSTETYLNNLSLQLSKNTNNKASFDTKSATEILRNSNVMLLDEKNITRLYVEDYFTRNNIKTNQLLEVSSMDLLIEFAKIGLGISCVIKEFVQEELKSKELIELSLNPPLKKRAVGFAYSKEAFLPQSLKHFISFYKERCSS
ncbi:DNA-binding transcriptional regulator, LysR family [Anaerocolumna xylanovorans DSM 12503]|uniref:DNA-binding transcriptional regulator, LysR family n=1 Tax=Anaerocolumna xylanovorans DSM 12503 TaxID=1121345 RepID=A0A1M7YJ17_9FIRM|nr:LysR family transcriptional regulator [Anaerocolumna xylanovorans]SHO52600.1 DNA-binding transcriptional regulator, LysR family [Anaerocolumna xylanovorans DSM 12503]